ncbi:carbamoyl-phosphate synthase (glutamine-hydrolyzing) large subunit [Clostridium sp. MSJ-11]|uniref:Carbamoyl phosphate synthase large chain n=1 Tax=Clostridium mobile TaxID=2841512 RepID=A0ABS6EJK7_9CLOT|nr:carbamoyl-phosphate synthase (glutamine-hydrolyzing) large subunit [Clostridium mobile]MBU5485389.1 carbamoyl-phosphate synthase (glutamine-hydrolyzing) large subunit [Clostridium mobile]
MPLDKTLNKVIILGSGPIIIGQGAEFDYSGTQACKALKEEGIEVVLVNSNPATIMTDNHIADRIYIEPLNEETLEKIIEKEKPQGILAGFGGQTALNLAMKLKDNGVLDRYNVRMLGVNSEAIKKAESREEFKNLMLEIGEPTPMSIIATRMEECEEFVEKYGFPVIIRPAYTLGGTGGGIANNLQELREICKLGLKLSPINQILLEQSVAGWKEIEFEVIRDKKDNCIIICSMENFDPVGIHTGDSIVVAPCQTLRDKEYQMLRKSSIDIIRSLKLEGGCNVQFALHPTSMEYIVIEVNPRVSRSSALASKATGYPIAKIAAKIAIGYSLDEIKNSVTGSSSACFEPVVDYVVTKIPKWPFDKFTKAERTLGTQMKATGEVMSIGRSFENSLLKGIISLDGKFTSLKMKELEKINKEELLEIIKLTDDRRVFAIAEGLKKGLSKNLINEVTGIDLWFLNGVENIINMEKRVEKESLSKEFLREIKELGFTDKLISELKGISTEEIERLREEYAVHPVYKMVDTCGGEFKSSTPYYYSSYELDNENIITEDKKVLIIGSGPIRIGQGIEFDYCSVHGIWGIKKAGYKAIIINNNPETVSTDFDTGDKLYFEPIYIENIMDVIREEKVEGVILELGGQTSINLAEELNRRGVKILGTSFQGIDLGEDRDKFKEFLDELNISSPEGIAVINEEEAYKAAEKIGYPVVVRPSYVIGGRAMEVVYNKESLEKYIKEAVSLSMDHPILIDRYIKGIEIEVDALCDGEEILIPGIMEHMERTGVHSGDSMIVYPTLSLKEEVINKIVEYTRKIGIGINIKGLLNIQYAYDGEKVYVIEVNPRASRTVPILSKIIGIPMVNISVQIKLGRTLKECGYGVGLAPTKNLYAVKVPVFSGEKLNNADIYLGPEMKSTGEVLGIGKSLEEALYKGFMGAGIPVHNGGNLYVSLKDVDRLESIDVFKEYIKLGFKIYATSGTARYLMENGIACEEKDFEQGEIMIKNGEISLVINTPTRGNELYREGFKLRRTCSQYRVPTFTCIDTAKAYLTVVDMVAKSNTSISYNTMEEYFS